MTLLGREKTGSPENAGYTTPWDKVGIMLPLLECCFLVRRRLYHRPFGDVPFGDNKPKPYLHPVAVAASTGLKCRTSTVILPRYQKWFVQLPRASLYHVQAQSNHIQRQ